MFGVDNERLRGCIEEESYLTCIPVSRCISEIAKLNVEEYSKIIHHVVIDVGGSDEFEKCLKDRDVHEITIRDVRGFGNDDVAGSELINMQEDTKKLAAYYGYEGVDAIILFNIAGGVFAGKTNQMYMTALKDAIALKPVIVLERSDLLRFMMVNRKKAYKEVVSVGDESKSIWYTDIFNTIDSVIEETIKGEQNNICKNIIKQYVRYLFIPDVKMQEDEQKMLILSR